MQELDRRTEQLSYDIIGAAIEVHKVLGPGLLESVYEEALCIEFDERQIPYEQQKEIGIDYKDRRIGKGYIDIFVDDRIVVELKSVERFAPIHTAQVMTYLRMTNTRLGLLFNFNSHLIKNSMKRIIL